MQARNALSVLSMSSLKRYKKYFGVSTRPALNKQQLVDVLLPHFMSLEVDEKEVRSCAVSPSLTHHSGAQVFHIRDTRW